MSAPAPPLGLAVPTGSLREPVGELLASHGLAMDGYEAGSRLLRSEANERGFRFRVFRERDIPIQVALGNYDLGICSDVWIAELQARFPGQRVQRVGALPGPATEVWLCAAPGAGLEPGQVPDPASLVHSCADLARSGACLFFSTLNRTPKSFLLGVVAAEHVLEILPRGTHDFARFLRPSELDAIGRLAGLTLRELSGLRYNPFTRRGRLHPDVGVNYLAWFTKD